MSVKSPLGLVLYCYLNMPTINKTDLILSYLILTRTTKKKNGYQLWCVLANGKRFLVFYKTTAVLPCYSFSSPVKVLSVIEKRQKI